MKNAVAGPWDFSKSGAASGGGAGNATSEIGRDLKWRLTQQVLDATAVREFHAAHAAPFVEQFQLLSDCLRAFAEKASKALDKGDEENLLAGDIAELRAYAVRIDRVGLAVSELTSPKLAEMSLVNSFRLSVQPVRADEWKEICRIGGLK